jgi:hypothetical protein
VERERREELKRGKREEQKRGEENMRRIFERESV